MKKLIFAVFALSFALSCSRDAYVTIRGYAQGGVYTVKYRGSQSDLQPVEVRDSIESLLKGIDYSVSGYNRKSVLSRFNAGDSSATDFHFEELKRLSDYYKILTDGAFDANAAPLFDVWGFGFTSDSLPPAASIDSAMALCRKCRQYNFNAIAQGYSCDAVASFLDRIGVRDMLVDIGEIYCRGVNPSGNPWTIGIDNPFDGNNIPGSDIRGVWTSDGKGHGIVTSGNYRKFYIRDGKKYSHTIDPRSGYPVDHDLLSATVVAPTATRADAIATFCMVVGTVEARDFILSDPELEACLITSDTLWCSPGF